MTRHRVNQANEAEGRMTSRCFYFAEKELIPLILLTQRMCPLDTVSIMNHTGERGRRTVPIQ